MARSAFLVVSLLLTLPLLPLAPAQSSEEVAPEDILALVSEIGSAWKLETSNSSTVAIASGLARAEPQRLVLDVSGLPVFSFGARVDKGMHLSVVVDGAEAVNVAEGTTLRQVPLGADARTLVFVAESAASEARAVLTLIGAETVAPPVITSLPSYLYGCVLPDLQVLLTSIVPLVGDATHVIVDGVPVNVSVEQHPTKGGILVTIRGEIPSGEEGVWRGRHLTITVEDVTGKVWTIANRLLYTLVDRGMTTGPTDWVYDLRPTITLTSYVCRPLDFAEYHLEVDGEDVTKSVMASWYTLAYRFPDELKFNETHSFTFSVALGDGATLTRSGTFREGLDVDEFDLAPGIVTSLIASSGASVELPQTTGATVAVTTRTDLPIAAGTIAVPLGGHARAVFAPLALACKDIVTATVCDPFSGPAPGFMPWGVPNAVLEVTPEGESMQTLAGAGQLAEAARMSRLNMPLDAAFPSALPGLGEET
ncbi:MAG: hypothetical protein WDA16_08755 [Candidatus Thermoplasmatota archaeon]